MTTEEHGDRASRLAHPKWEQVLGVTGGSLGPVLRALYADNEIIQKRDFVVEVYSPDRDDMVEEQVIHFLPADEMTLSHPWREYLPPDAFPFAEDVFGDLLFVELSAESDDPPVKHWYHDGGDIEMIAPRLSTFVKACRENGA